MPNWIHEHNALLDSRKRRNAWLVRTGGTRAKGAPDRKRSLRIRSCLRVFVFFTVFFVVCNPLPAGDEETSHTPIVLGGIPLCGDPLIAKEFLSPHDSKRKKKFEKQWNTGKDKSDGIIAIQLSDPDIALELKGRDPSSLYIHLFEGRVHQVVARWRAKGTRWGFETLTEELYTKARAVLGEPNEILESESMIVLAGIKEPVKTLVWHDEHRVTRIFERKTDMKWYVAVEITCTDTLKDSVGGENIF